MSLRRFRLRQLNPFRRSENRPVFLRNHFNFMANVAQRNREQFMPSIQSQLGETFKAKVVGIRGVGPIDGTKFPTLKRAIQEEYGAGAEPSYYQVYIHSPEMEATSPNPLDFTSRLSDTDPVNAMSTLAVYQHSFGPMSPSGQNEVPFNIGSTVEVRYINKATLEEPLIVGVVSSNFTNTSLANLQSARNSYYRNRRPVNPAPGNPNTVLLANTADVSAAVQDALNAGDAIAPLFGDTVSVLTANETNDWLRGPRGRLPYGATGATRSAHKGTDVYFPAGIRLCAPINFEIASNISYVYGRGSAPAPNPRHYLDYGRSLSLYPLDDSGDRLKAPDGQDIIVVLRHLKLSSSPTTDEDGLARASGRVNRRAILGYTYWADPHRYEEFISELSVGPEFNTQYGAPDSPKRRTTYEDLTNIRTQAQDNTRVVQNHMPAGSGAHIHFEVRLGRGADAPFAHPDALLDYNEFLC